MDLDAISDALRKEAKSLFFAKVARDIKKARTERSPMRRKDEFIRAYRKALARYNQAAQKAKIPLGLLLYREVFHADYWWMNALNGYHIGRGSVQVVRDSVSILGGLYKDKDLQLDEGVALFKTLLQKKD